MRFLFLIIPLILTCDKSSDDISGSSDAENCNGNTCQFSATITLNNNSTPIEGADVIIQYDVSSIYGNTSSRASQTIQYIIPSDGHLKITEYDLDGNALRILFDEITISGSNNIPIENPDSLNLAPFGISLTKIILEFNNQTTTKYSVLMTAPDFYQAKNLGQTNELGQFVLDSEFLTSYTIPTFYDVSSIDLVDSEGNILGQFALNDYINGLKIYFLYEEVYKSFNIDLINGIYNYSFDWNEGQIENFSNKQKDNEVNNLESQYLDVEIPAQLLLYPNPYN